MKISRGDVVELLKKFFSKDQTFNFGNSKNRVVGSYYDELLELGTIYPDKRSIEVRYEHIKSFDKRLARDLIFNSDQFLEAATDAIAEIELPVLIQRKHNLDGEELREYEEEFMFEEEDEEDEHGLDSTMKKVKVQVIGMPENYIIPISNLRHEHIERFLSIKCTVSKSTEVRPRIIKAVHQCLRCGHKTETYIDQDDTGLTNVIICENDTCGKKGPFKLLKGESQKIDKHFLKVQEPLENLRGRQPKYLHVSCCDELVDQAKPGDKLIITGKLEGKIRVTKEGKSPDMEFYLSANSIKKSEKDFENLDVSIEEEKFFHDLSKRPDIEMVIASSICPSIYGYENVKLGIAYQLFGGVRTYREDGTIIRGDLHVLLIGDPGIAKSKMLRYVYGFAPRAVIGSGGTTSGVGICGAAVQDEFDKRWSIESGLLTLAGDGGICCLDELEKLSPSDRAMLHPAMEQQFIDMAKAGTFAHLPATCGILGAANPKYGRFDSYDSIASQFNLGDTLLSRFDLVYALRDKIDAEFDMNLAMKVLDDGTEEKPALDSECLRKYIAYAKTHFKPKMTDEAKKYLAPFYVSTRAAGKGTDTIPITVRTLESAKRLSAAHAKMRLSNKIELVDAKAAVDLLLCNLREVGIDPDTGQFDSRVLISGTSESQHKRIKLLKEIIKDLMKRNISDGSANLEDVKRIALENDIKDSEYLIKRIKEKGEIMFPSQQTVKLVK